MYQSLFSPNRSPLQTVQNPSSLPGFADTVGLVSAAPTSSPLTFLTSFWPLLSFLWAPVAHSHLEDFANSVLAVWRVHSQNLCIQVSGWMPHLLRWSRSKLKWWRVYRGAVCLFMCVSACLSVLSVFRIRVFHEQRSPFCLFSVDCL